MLYAVAVATVLASARQLGRIHRLDYSAPVVAIQHELAELTASRVRVTRWLLSLSPLIWTPLAILGARGILGFDRYEAFGPAWVAWNLAFGLAMIPVAIWIARHYSETLGTSPLLKHLADDMAGRSLVRAKKELDQIMRFEDER